MQENGDKSPLVKTTGHLDNGGDVLGAAFCDPPLLLSRLSPWARRSELQAIVMSEASKLSKSTLRPTALTVLHSTALHYTLP